LPHITQFVPRIQATKHPAGKYMYKQLHAVTAAGQRGETTLDTSQQVTERHNPQNEATNIPQL